MEKLISSCVTAMVARNVIEKEKQQVIVYGLDLLFSSVISLMSFVVLGVILGKEIETLILLAIYIPLQSFGGGYHCETHFRCWLLMMVGYLVAVFGMMNLPSQLLWTGALMNAYSFFKLAPVENPKAPFSERFRGRMHCCVMSLYFVALILAAGVMWRRCELLGPILTAVVLSGVSIVSAKLKKKMY